MNVLIAGYTGFIGSNLCDNLGQHNLIGVDIHHNEKIRHFYDWTNLKDTPSPDIIIHLAGKAHDTQNTADPKQYFDINVGLTRKIFDFFLESNASKFIFFSSVKAVADTVPDEWLTEEDLPNPQTSYGKSKLEAENYINTALQNWYEDKHTPGEKPDKAQDVFSLASKLGKSVYILRPAMVHGPGNKGNLNLLYKVVKIGIPWPLGSYHNQRSFTSIDNLNFIVGKLISEPIKPGIYQVADDEVMSTNNLISLMGEVVGKNSLIVNLPKPIVMTVARMGDLLHLPLNTERLKKLTESYRVSNAKIKKALGIENLPVTEREGMLKTMKNFQ